MQLLLKRKGTEVQNETAESNTNEIKKKKTPAYKKILVSTLVAALLMSAGIVGGAKFLALYPYAITNADDDVICYVKDKDAAGKAVRNAVKALNKDNGEMLVVSLGDSIKVARADSLSKRDDVVASKEAAERIIKSTKDSGSSEDGLKIVSLKKEKRKFMPDTIYEKGETMLAGQKEVKAEGKEGLEEVTVSVTAVNGRVAEEEDIDSVMLDKGENPVIVKGVLGVPEGEDWRTYTGDPVAKNGGEIITTAQEYIGQVRYRRGGVSLETGVDCVGFVRAIYRLYGIDLPASLRKQGVHISYSNAQAGDIICYPKHYGIYIGGGKMVHATSGKGVSIGSVNLKKLTDVRRIVTE